MVSLHINQAKPKAVDIELFRATHDFANEVRITVDLDKERGRPIREDRPNRHVVLIRKARNQKIRMAALQGYLEGKSDFNTSVLEAISKSGISVKCDINAYFS